MYTAKEAFHVDDIVRRKSDGAIGMVERTFADITSHASDILDFAPDRADGVSKDSYVKFLADGVPPKGTVMIEWQFLIGWTLISESDLELVNRSLIIGDIVRRHPGDSMSGTVVNVISHCTLRSMLPATYLHKWTVYGMASQLSQVANFELNKTDSRIEGIPLCELTHAEPLAEGAVVAFRGWVGYVVDLSCRLTVRLADGAIVQVESSSVKQVDGSDEAFTVGDVVRRRWNMLRQGVWIHGQYDPVTPAIGTIIALDVEGVNVNWVYRRTARTQLPKPSDYVTQNDIGSAEFAVYHKSKWPIGVHSNAMPLATKSYREIVVRPRTRVRFKQSDLAYIDHRGTRDTSNVPHLLPTEDTHGYDVNVFEVETVQSDVIVEWQDLTITREMSVDVVLDIAWNTTVDMWPGEVVYTLAQSFPDEAPSLAQADKVGIVQSVQADQKMVAVRWFPKGVIQHAQGSNGRDYDILVTAYFGVAAEQIESVSLYELAAPERINARRGDMVVLPDPCTSNVVDGAHDVEATSNEWLAEIVNTLPDGRLEVRLGLADQIRDIVVERDGTFVAIRDDDLYASDLDTAMDDVGSESVHEEAEAYYIDEDGRLLDDADVHNDEWESASDGDVMDVDTRAGTLPVADQAPTENSPVVTTSNHDSRASSREHIVDHAIPDKPEQYSVLEESVPPDHNFWETVSGTNVTHNKRTQREHAILAAPGSLPAGVYVRTWESRMDLLRILFIGPDETPYQKAPFVMDLYLDGKFPSEPPKAHFHSWQSEGAIGGTGKVNPNLYEDGKICLSLLGTWEGDQQQKWNPSASTLLQIIVSVLGLVLVAEPYYNEAGAEANKGSVETKRSSAEYSEQTYIRARTFLLAACETIRGKTLERDRIGGLEGLRDVMTWLYLGDEKRSGPNLLARSIHELETLLATREVSIGGATKIVSVSKGACIPLRRILERLKRISPAADQSLQT